MSNRSVGRGLLRAGQGRAETLLQSRTAVCLTLAGIPCHVLPKALAGSRAAAAHSTAICSSNNTELVVGIKGAINFPLNRAMSFCVCLLQGSEGCAPTAFEKWRSAW